MSESYECDQCGACCRTKLVDVYDIDLLREPQLRQHLQPLKQPGLDGEVGYLNCLTDRACSFLDRENRCGIYPTRPSICVLFEAGSDECQESRRVLEIPPLEPVRTTAIVDH